MHEHRDVLEILFEIYSLSCILMLMQSLSKSTNSRGHLISWG